MTWLTGLTRKLVHLVWVVLFLVSPRLVLVVDAAKSKLPIVHSLHHNRTTAGHPKNFTALQNVIGQIIFLRYP
jgi:hypothetical protein